MAYFVLLFKKYSTLANAAEAKSPKMMAQSSIHRCLRRAALPPCPGKR